ncbi:MAG: phage terminase large subunit, partial [Ruthenibacterium sp.]
YLLTGGRGSCKSTFVAIEVLLLLKKHPDCHALVLRKVAGTLRDSVYGQYVWTADMLGVLCEYEQRTAPPELICRATGQRILFRGADDRAKIKSLKMPFGYIGVTHFEEKDQFDSRAELRSILQSTMRGGALFWNFETSNPPVRPAHWTNRELTAAPRADTLFHHGDYRSVPRAWLGEQFFAEAEALRTQDETAWRHEYLGQAVGVGAQVFANVQRRALTEEEIKAFDRVYMGVDWGYFPDPFVFVKAHFDAARRVLYLFDEIFAVRKSNAETAALCRNKGAAAGSVWADSAEPKSVADFRAAGLLCRAVGKGAGSVAYSMKWLASLAAIVIDPARCPRTAREFTEYEHERDAAGEVTEGYPDRDNHAIDAVRYALYPVWRRKGQ